MKFDQVAMCTMLMMAIVNAYSFSDMTRAAPASAPNNGTDMTADEESRIYGGKSAKFKNYPYMASLRANGSVSGTFCGGTLIAPQYVLTAAHCTDWYLYDVYVSLGSKHRSGRDSGKSEQIRVVEAFRHPEYRLFNISAGTHDVAMLKLERPTTYSPALLPNANGSNNKPDNTATTLGWGLINNETLSETLRAVDVNIISNTKCSKLYMGEESIVDDSVICAGSGGGKDSRAGDSGGPLVVIEVVVGIVSAGADDCGVLPGIYARVTYALDFINDILNGGSTGNVTELLTAGAMIFDENVYTSQDASAMDSIDVE